MFTEAGEGVVFERFIVQCMNLIKMIVKNDAYKPAKNIEGRQHNDFGMACLDFKVLAYSNRKWITAFKHIKGISELVEGKTEVP